MIRIKHNPSPTSKLLVGAAIKPELPLVSEILERYLETKGDDKAELFSSHTKRDIGDVVPASGNKNIYRDTQVAK